MKKVIFILRGLGRESGHWGEFPKILKGALGDFEVVPLDLPGFGVFYDEVSPSSIKGIVENLISKKVFDKYKGFDEKYILALSLGGMVTLELLQNMKGFFNGVVIMNSSQKYKNSILNRLNFKFLPKAFYAILFATTGKRESIIFDGTINTLKDKEKFVLEWVNFFDKRPYKRISFFKQLWAASKFSLKGVSLEGERGLVLSSKGDRLVKPMSSQIISDHLKWPIEYHDNAGHDLPFDDPVWICNKVSEFIKK
ncbi:MAG: alpha/beta fold hydrolase [Bdellovibrionales bacterium]